MAKALVTGGAGFIGSHLVEALIKKKYEVKVIDNLFTGKKENLKEVINDIEFIKGDICNYKLLQKCTKDVDFIFHEAALRNVRASVEHPYEYNKVNIEGTLNLLNAAKENNVKRIIFASSSSVYGNTKIFPSEETHLPAPISPYALTKISGEYYMNLFHELYDLETISLRYFNVYGPRQDFKSQYAAVIAIFIYKLLNNQKPEIFGDGNQSRDFTYVQDVIDANIAAMEAKKNACGNAFNIAEGKSISINYILKRVNECLGKSVKAKYSATKPGDVQKTQADPKKAMELLKFKCKISFDEGIKRTIDWFKDNPPSIE